MNILDEIVITDEDIDWVESIMEGDISFDKERRDIIKDLRSIDIQAFPGSGKTTVLVAKLAILANKWTSTSSGICVLSHTNVAREEIEKRIGGTSVGGKLLNYPHFIGTVHSFFTTYVALPWMRSNKKKIEVIETDFTIDYRWNRVPKWYKDTIFEPQFISKSSCCYVEKLGNLKLRKYTSTSKPYSIIESVINESHQKGYYTFDEVLLYAKDALENNTSISEICSTRFPVVFIDEAQDTNAFQYEMIQKCFVESVQQGVGDENQAIYGYVGEVSNSNFPRSNPLVLSQSKRFSNSVASLANPLAVSKSTMEGVNKEFENKQHAIFIFKKEEIGKVLDAYGKYILDTFTDEEILKYKNDGCYAVGLIHNKNGETKEKQIPRGVFDYYPQYESKSITKGYTKKYLIDYFRAGEQRFRDTNATYEQIELILLGFKKVVLSDPSEKKIVNTKNLIKFFSEYLVEREKILRFRKKLILLRKCNLDSENEWKKYLVIVNEIFNLLEVQLIDKNFLKWIPTANVSTPEFRSSHETKSSQNEYRYELDGRTVNIKLNSIHGVKGKTHLSTLVLETYHKSHRLKQILPYIYGKKHTPKSESENKNLKCHYVAMTRARGLLCLAIPEGELTVSELKKLESKGLNIIYL